MIKKLLLALVMANITYAQNNYLDFDGTNDNVTVANSGNMLAGATAITMSCKVYPKSTTTGFPLFDGFAGYRNETNFDFYLIQLSSTQLEARFRNSAGTAYSITYNGLTLNQWTQFFLVYDGSTLRLYSGATQVGSTPASGTVPASNTSTFKVGLVQFQTYNWYHNGYIDEVSLWNKGLSAAEIAAIMGNNGDIANPMAETNLKLYYKFNQGVPYGTNTGLTSVTDEMGVNTGTLNNFALVGNTSNWGSQQLGNDNWQTQAATIFPNPAADVLHFSGFDAIHSIALFDLSGRLVLEKAVSDTNGPSINVSSLQSGLYVAVINNSHPIKFLKK